MGSRLLAGAFLLLFAFPARAETRPPNIVLVTLDTTRADRLGCYGGDGTVTPNLDALAARGTRFARAQSPAPLTVPAHASMLTGLVPRNHGARDNALYPLPADVPVLAELLAGRGYDTAAFVSSYVLDRRAGLDRGFRIYDDRVRVGRREAFNYEERAASQTNEAVLARLDELEEPFFLWVHYFDPHLPYVPPPPYDERFAERPYDGEVAFMDDAIGRLLAALPESLVVVAGDHGESLGEHGEKAHGVFLYQATQRVPLILAGPGVTKRVVEERVGLVDLLPTVLDLAGVETPAGIDGRSLAPLLAGKKKWKPRDYEMESLYPSLAFGWAALRAMVRGDLAVIDAPRRETYDLAADSTQSRNLGSGRPEARRLFAKLERLEDTTPAATVDAERRMRLESLGYVSSAGAAPGDSAIDPKDGIAWLDTLDAARAAIQLGRPAEALEPLVELIEKNPGNLPARLALVAARMGAGDATGAATVAREALELAPEDDLVVFNLANALSAESATRPAAAAEAAKQYERVLALNPRRADAYLNYAALLAASGRPDRARELFVRAEAAGVVGPDLLVDRAVLELMQGRPTEAIRFFEEALRLNPYAEDVRQALKRLREIPGDRR